jgi:hypothetical protein
LLLSIIFVLLNLEQWCKIDESIYIADTDEQYKQYGGFAFNEEILKSLAEMKLYNSRIFINSFSQPRSLFINTIESMAYSKTIKLYLELHKARDTKIVSATCSLNNSPVNWSNWRQFNSFEKNPQTRKKVFDEFIEQTKNISQLIDERFLKIRQTYEECESINASKDSVKLDPLSGYLENENISYDKLVEFITSLGNRAKKPFRDALTVMSKQLFGREPEYYDDFYFYRNKVYADIENNFSSVDPIDKVKNVLNTLEFDLSKIHFDGEDRKNKYISPVCFFVQIPEDIRVLYKSESPYFDLQACFHETGHAAHASSIGKDNNYWDKYQMSTGIIEIFSIFFERLTKNNTFLAEILPKNTDLGKINELNSRNKFMELFFITFYTANSLMKLEFWRKNLTVDQASDTYSKLIKEYTGFEMPGEYWLLHHILPDSIMYVPSYLLAAVRASELDLHIQNKFGNTWWKEKEAGKVLKDIMKPGAKINLPLFSKLDPEIYMKEILG